MKKLGWQLHLVGLGGKQPYLGDCCSFTSLVSSLSYSPSLYVGPSVCRCTAAELSRVSLFIPRENTSG